MTVAEVLQKLGGRDLAREAGAEIQALMQSRITRQFSELRAGGASRGVTWQPFKNPWYVRSDGTEVPIWGGVPKMNGKEKVKGKLRSKNPEGKKRYTVNSALMQSTGMLKAALLADMRISENVIELRTPVLYAGYQNALREWNFVSQEEASVMASMVLRKVMG